MVSEQIIDFIAMVEQDTTDLNKFYENQNLFDQFFTKQQKFKCESCDDHFSNSEHLKIHQSIHQDNNQCNKCLKTFSRKSSLKCHLRFHIENDNGEIPKITCKRPSVAKTKTKKLEHSCSFCEKSFSKPSLLTRHVRSHTKEKPFECNQCGKGFGQLSSLKIHEKIHSDARAFNCNLCCFKFTQKGNLELHKKRVHSTTNVPANSPKYCCSQCPCTFKLLFSLNRHITLVHQPKEKIKKCKFCSKQFKSNYELDRHEDCHRNERKFICDLCGITFNVKCTLIAHMRTNHLNPIEKGKVPDHPSSRFYKCPHCPASFNRNSHLTQHVSSIHLQAKNFRCDYCGKAFNRKSVLDIHINSIHTRAKIYVCSVCKLDFATADSLKKHEKYLHPTNDNVNVMDVLMMPQNKKENFLLQIGQAFYIVQDIQNINNDPTGQQEIVLQAQEVDAVDMDAILNSQNAIEDSPRETPVEPEENHKKHKCDNCAKSFAKKDDLRRHERTHTKEKPFKCDICGKTFTLRSTLKTHSKTHDKDKRTKYACEICGNLFSSKSSMDLHMRIHNGVKPFVCPEVLCGKAFRTSGHLKCHMESHKKQMESFNSLELMVQNLLNCQ